MKKLFVVNLCILSVIFLTAGMAEKPASLSKEAAEIISGRITILNSYYSGKREFDETRSRLEKIETGKILKEDVALMKGFARSDIEQIPEHKVKIKSCQGKSRGLVKGEALITYILEGNQGKFKQSGRYYFTAEKKKEKLKLTQLEKL